MKKPLLGEEVRTALMLVAVGLVGASVITGKSGLMLGALVIAAGAAALTFIERRQRLQVKDGRTRGCYWPTDEELQYGTKVRTTVDAGANDWTAEGRAKRRWGARGTVIDRSDAHGLCYGVRHKDGSVAWYEPTELEPR